MRKAMFGGASSLDNYIARKYGSFDWIMHGDEAMEIMKDLWPRFDAMVMGRKTYDVAVANLPKSKKKKNPFGDMQTFAFSRTLEPAERYGVTITSEDPGKFVRKLKKQPGKDICVMGGGELGRALFEAGVIDEIGFNIHPVLLGSGIPLFHQMKKQINLKLLECKPLKNVCVYVLYKVKN